MKLYLINLSAAIEDKTIEAMKTQGLEANSYHKIANLSGFSSLLDESLLVIDTEYHAEELRSEYQKIRKVSDNPVIFVVNDDEYYQEISESLEGFDKHITIVRGTDLNSDLIRVKLTGYKNFKLRKQAMKAKGLTVDIEKFQCVFNQKEIDLTKTEMTILHFMIASGDENITHDDLMLVFKVRGKNVSANTLSSHIRNIKNKVFSATGEKEFIISKYGFGYRL